MTEIAYSTGRPFWQFVAFVALLLVLLGCSVGALMDAHRYERATRRP